MWNSCTWKPLFLFSPLTMSEREPLSFAPHTPHLGQYASLSWITITTPFPRTITSSLRHPLPLESLNFTVCSSGTRRKKLPKIYFHSFFYHPFFCVCVTSLNTNRETFEFIALKSFITVYETSSKSTACCNFRLIQPLSAAAQWNFLRCHPLT